MSVQGSDPSRGAPSADGPFGVWPVACVQLGSGLVRQEGFCSCADANPVRRFVRPGVSGGADRGLDNRKVILHEFFTRDGKWAWS